MWRKHLDQSQTIFALATGSLPTAVAIVRLSGPDAFAIAKRIFSPIGGRELSRDRCMVMGILHDRAGEKIDEVLALTFVAPHSFTGEDTIEFQCHGSLAVIRRLEEILIEERARPAERGEFSFRAHLNGKLSAMDLDGLGDLYLARQIADLSRIYHRKDASLEVQIGVLRETLIRTQAILDTAVDFSEEYSEVLRTAIEPTKRVIRECSAVIQRYSGLKEGVSAPRLVLAGRPNAGKSSLFNALLCRYRAIVHQEPGTTRDVVEEDVEIGGRTWKLVDTAGLRSGAEGAEREGISLGQDFLHSSSFWILVVDGSVGMSEEEFRLLETFQQKPHLIAWNKSDVGGWKISGEDLKRDLVPVSALGGDGVSDLWNKIVERAQLLNNIDHDPLPTSVQCARLKKVVEQLEAMETGFGSDLPPEYLAEQNRHVIRSLESVVGEVSTEDILDRVFGEFCIGK